MWAEGKIRFHLEAEGEYAARVCRGEGVQDQSNQAATTLGRQVRLGEGEEGGTGNKYDGPFLGLVLNPILHPVELWKSQVIRIGLERMTPRRRQLRSRSIVFSEVVSLPRWGVRASILEHGVWQILTSAKGEYLIDK